MFCDKLKKFYKKKKVLVSGGAGFIGSQVVDQAVLMGACVTVVDNLRTGSLANLRQNIEKIDFVQMDICSPKIRSLVQENEIVFHLAAIATIGECESSPGLCELVNANATARICQNLPRWSKIVFSSTSAVYGNTDQACDENAPLEPISCYAKCKTLGEQACAKLGGRAVALRYFNVYGPRNSASIEKSSVVNKFLFALRNGLPITIFGDGLQKRDYVSVLQVARANLIAGAAQNTKFEVYNIASGQSITLLELLDKLEKIVGKKCVDLRFLSGLQFDVKNSLANCDKYKKLLKKQGGEDDLARENFSICANIF